MVYQLLIACSEDQPDNEIRCVEHLLQRQVDAIIVSTALPPEHPFYQRWANRSCRLSRLTAHWKMSTLSVGRDDFGTPKCWHPNCVSSPAESVVYLGALPELSVSFLREQGIPRSPEGMHVT